MSSNRKYMCLKKQKTKLNAFKVIVTMIRAKLVFLFTFFVICKLQPLCENEGEHVWSYYQKLNTIQFGLSKNKNLNKYVNFSIYSTIDNQAFIDDKTKVKRAYNTEQCTRYLQQIRDKFSHENGDRALESKQFYVSKAMITC